MEPRAATPELRLAAIEELASAGIPCGVMVAPVVPAITDHEMPAILDAARMPARGRPASSSCDCRGRSRRSSSMARRTLPRSQGKVLNRIRDLRGGKLYDAKWGVRGRGEGVFAEQIAAHLRCRLPQERPQRSHRDLSAASFRRRGARHRYSISGQYAGGGRLRRRERGAAKKAAGYVEEAHAARRSRPIQRSDRAECTPLGMNMKSIFEGKKISCLARDARAFAERKKGEGSGGGDRTDR